MATGPFPPVDPDAVPYGHEVEDEKDDGVVVMGDGVPLEPAAAAPIPFDRGCIMRIS